MQIPKVLLTDELEQPLFNNVFGKESNLYKLQAMTRNSIGSQFNSFRTQYCLKKRNMTTKCPTTNSLNYLRLPINQAIKLKEKNYQLKDPLTTQNKGIVPNIFESLKSEVINIRISTMTDQWENTMMNADLFY